MFELAIETVINQVKKNVRICVVPFAYNHVALICYYIQGKNSSIHAHMHEIIIVQVLHYNIGKRTWPRFSGVQFLELPSPLSNTGAIPHIPPIDWFQSRLVQASKEK